MRRPGSSAHLRLPAELRLGASVMSGWRCVGSSAGSGRCTIFEREPVSSITSSASSRIVNSPGLPRLTGPVKSSGVVHQPHEALDQVVDVAERARLRAVAVDRDRLAVQRLDDEVRHHAAVVGVHARAVGVEDARDLDVELVLAVVVEEQRLGAALALVVAGARADRVDVAPVGSRAADAPRDRRRPRWSRPGGSWRCSALGQAQHVDRADARWSWSSAPGRTGSGRRGRAGEVVDLVDLDVEREGHVVAHQLEARVAEQVRDVALACR